MPLTSSALLLSAGQNHFSSYYSDFSVSLRYLNRFAVQLFTAPHINNYLRQQLGSKIYSPISASHSAATAAAFFPLHTSQLREEGEARWGRDPRSPPAGSGTWGQSRRSGEGRTPSRQQRNPKPEADFGG